MRIICWLILSASVFTACADGGDRERAPAAGVAQVRHAVTLPPIDQTVVTSFHALARDSLEARQIDYQPGILEPTRAAMLKGRVVGPEGELLGGATVRVVGRDELGHTETDAEGDYALSVDATGAMTVEITAAGLLPAQRAVLPRPNEILDVGLVKLVATDPLSTPIGFGETWQEIQAHDAQPVTDARGTRRATLIFHPMTRATLHYPDGQTDEVSELHVTATEFTAGEQGPEAMPADIAFGTIFTYALEFSATEIETTGATHAYFDPPATMYLENFLDIPVGTVVPSGSYERADQQWIGELDGRVVQVMRPDPMQPFSEDNVGLDVAGNGTPATPGELEALGIGDAELAWLGEHRQDGEQLWRTPVPHFTAPYDLNFSGQLPDDAMPPDDWAVFLASKGGCRRSGSVIECEDQVLGETLELADLPFALHYRSSRTAGSPDYGLSVRVTGESVPLSMRLAKLSLHVAGRVIENHFPAPVAPETEATIRWDGLDSDGRPVQGAQPVKICVGYQYPMTATVRLSEPGEGGGSGFGNWVQSGVRMSDDAEGARGELRKCYGRDGLSAGGMAQGAINQGNMYTLGALQARDAAVKLGGWTLGVHHTLDPQTGTLYLGTGETRKIESKKPMAIRVAGNGLAGGVDSELLPAISVPMQPRAIAVASDNSLYVALAGQVRRVMPDGSWTRVAGTGTSGFTGYTGVATSMQIGLNLVALELSARGDLFIADASNQIIWLLREGTLTRLVGASAALGNDLDLGFAMTSESPRSIFAPAYPTTHPQYGRIIARRREGESYPSAVNLACLRDIDVTDDGQRMWILQRCGASGDKRIRYMNLQGDLPWLGDLGGHTWIAGQNAAGLFYDHPARVKHVAGWPYPAWMDIADRPVAPVPDQEGDNFGWWGSNLGGDNLGFPGTTFGEQWAAWHSPQSITTDARGNVFVVENHAPFLGPAGAIRKFYPGSGTTTLGLQFEVVEAGDGTLQCNSTHCTIELTADEGIDDVIEELAAHDGTLHYVTLANEGAGLFSSNGPLPGVRVLGGGAETLDVDQVMAPALDYDLQQASDIAVGPDGTVYVADFIGRKVVRVATVSTAGYQGSVVASEDGAEYYVFDEHGRHLSTHDGTTHVALWTFGYDDAGALTTLTDRVTRVTTIARGVDHEPLSITTPDGRVITLGLSDGYLSQVVQPSGATHVLTYNLRGLLRRLITPEGRVHSYTYDGDGRLILDADPEGRTQELELIEHTGTTRVVRHLDQGGRATDYALEIFGSEKDVLATQTWPDGSVTTRRQYPDGRVESTDAAGVTYELEYAPHPQFGPTASYVSRLEMRLPGGGPVLAAERTIEIDPACTLLPVSEHCAEVQGAEIQPRDLYADRITETTTINGGPRRVIRRFTRAYSGIPAEILIVSAEDRARRIILDDLGRPERVELGTWVAGSFVHGGYGDHTMAYRADGRLGYTRLGAGPTAPEVEIERSVGPAGATVTVTTASGSEAFGYDVDGWLTTIDSALGQAMFQADDDGFMTAYRPEQGGWHQFDWLDPSTALYQPPGDFMIEGPETYTLHADGRLATVEQALMTPISFAYDGAGRLASITRSEGVLSVSYSGSRLDTIADPDGGTLAHGYQHGVLSSVTRAGPETAGTSQTMSWAMGPNLLLASESVNGGHTVSFGYDDDDQLVTAGALALAPEPVTGGVDTTTLGSITMDVDYNAQRAPQSISYVHGGLEIFGQTIAYDADGRIETVVETVEGVSQTIAYQYDAASRLERVTVDGVVVDDLSYGPGLDLAGRTRDAGLEIPVYDGDGRLQALHGTTYEYDPTGRRVSATGPAESFDYKYDSAGQLATVPSHDIVYARDGRGRRVGKQVGGVRERAWLYRSQYQIAAELDGTGDLVSRFVYATQSHVPSYMVRLGALYQLVTDVRGSVRLVVDATTGDVAQRLDYDAWGRVLVDTNPGFQPFGFAGGLYDPETGLVHFGARDYDPQVGRFLQPDPQLFWGGHGNLHAYAGFDPVNQIDPTGEVPDWVLDAWTDYFDQPGLGDFIIGAGDGATLGVAAALRSALGYDDVEPDHCGLPYLLGEVAGQFLLRATLAKAAGAPPKLRKHCFAAGTLVETRDGLVAIEDVAIGDLVWSRDETTGEERWQPVTRLVETEGQRVLELVLEADGGARDVLLVTPEHPLWSVDEGWVWAGDLAVGDVVDTLAGEMVVASGTTLAAPETVYNFEVDEFHTYFVGDTGVWVHNANCDDPEDPKGADPRAPAGGKEHRENASEQTRNKHEEGQARKQADRGNRKGQKEVPRRRPKNWQGPWPPK